MTDTAGQRADGEIYDLGYRHYDGPRLGRGYAFRSLWAVSVRNTFGFGRGALPKVLAIGLTMLAYLPAVFQVAFGAVTGSSALPAEAGESFELLPMSDYFGGIQIVLVLFVAAMASDLVGNDRKNNTLALYFSRPIKRDDYVLAKILALWTALLALTMLPLLLAFVGNWLGAANGGEWFGDNWSDLPRIVASSMLVCAMLAPLGVLLASFSSRRAFAMITVLAALLFSFIATSNIVGLVSPAWGRLAMLVSPLFVMRAATLVIFDALRLVAPQSIGEAENQIAFVDAPTWWWFVALAMWIGVSTMLAVRRYRRMI